VVVATDYGVLFQLPDYVSAAAVVGFVLLLPLYLSQRRDLRRLDAWMAREPDHPAADLAASETLLDRAEADLEATLGVATEGTAAEPAAGAQGQAGTAIAPPRPATPQGAPATPLPPAQRVTSERPALERITMERAALLPHPRWRRLMQRLGQPRVLGVVALLAVVLGLVAIFGSERLLSGGGTAKHEPKPGAVVPGDVTVAVLNGTSAPGLAAKVGDDVQANGFKLGTETSTARQFDQTVVMYGRGEKRAASRVAHDLGVKPLQPLDRQTQKVAGAADVVVIAGADRAKP
jgi:hypothetical protein